MALPQALVVLGAGVAAWKGVKKLRGKQSETTTDSDSQPSRGDSIETESAFITAVREHGVVIGETRYFTEGTGPQTRYKMRKREIDEVQDVLKSEVKAAFDEARDDNTSITVGDFDEVFSDKSTTRHEEMSSYSAGTGHHALTPDSSNRNKDHQSRVQESENAHRTAQARSPPVELGEVYKIVLEEETPHHSGRRDMRGVFQGFQIFVKDVPTDVKIHDAVTVKITSFNRNNRSASATLVDE